MLKNTHPWVNFKISLNFIEKTSPKAYKINCLRGKSVKKLNSLIG